MDLAKQNASNIMNLLMSSRKSVYCVRIKNLNAKHFNFVSQDLMQNPKIPTVNRSVPL